MALRPASNITSHWARRLFIIALLYCGNATAANIPIIKTTTSSSISVKPWDTRSVTPQGWYAGYSVWTAPISRIKTLRDDEGRGVNPRAIPLIRLTATFSLVGEKDPLSFSSPREGEDVRRTGEGVLNKEVILRGLAARRTRESPPS